MKSLKCRIIDSLKGDYQSIRDRFASRSWLRIGHPFRNNAVETQQFTMSLNAQLEIENYERSNRPLPELPIIETDYRNMLKK